MVSLLFDANLSPKLVNRLSDLFPGSKHVFEMGFAQDAADETIWAFAAKNDFVIVTADSDFFSSLKFAAHRLKLFISPGVTTGRPGSRAYCEEALF